MLLYPVVCEASFGAGLGLLPEIIELEQWKRTAKNINGPSFLKRDVAIPLNIADSEPHAWFIFSTENRQEKAARAEPLRRVRQTALLRRAEKKELRHHE